MSTFYQSLAALDVDENERAAELLESIVTQQPNEPALWANLAIARLRLQSLTGAHEAIAKALSLDKGTHAELTQLHAEVLIQLGNTEAAIGILRELHHKQPSKVAATYLLCTLLGQIRTDEADHERLDLLEAILVDDAANLRARCEAARLAASSGRKNLLRANLDALLRQSDLWPKPVRDHLREADQSATAEDLRQAAQSLTFFENNLKPTPEYQRSVRLLGLTGNAPIGTPIRGFMVLNEPTVEAAPADKELHFELQRQELAPIAAHHILALPSVANQTETRLIALGAEQLTIGDLPSMAYPAAARSSASPACIADINSDFLPDVVTAGADGCVVWLQQATGAFERQEIDLSNHPAEWSSIWCIDVEADGDLDLVVSDGVSRLSVLRNNGDQTFFLVPPSEIFADVGIQILLCSDFDNDGDLDVVVKTARGKMEFWQNERSGRYVTTLIDFADSETYQVANATVGDIDRDGRFELVAIAENGMLWSAEHAESGSWAAKPLAAARLPIVDAADATFMTIVDLDNNGVVDVIVCLGNASYYWLQNGDDTWPPQPTSVIDLAVSAVADVNNDGRLDLIGLKDDQPQVAINQSQSEYGWVSIRTLATQAEGDKRINSFGIGGQIQIRAGRLAQAGLIQAPATHFGLGNHSVADVARITWPNGTVQAEFDLPSRLDVVSRQRLKGSCPWVFVNDGRSFHFIKDFIWRSPLGLRINAQTTAGIVQTEDWIKIPGSAMSAVDQTYQVRITAELWETHFFDMVRLVAVSYPAQLDVILDERFVPNEPPANRVYLIEPPRLLERPIDDQGNSLDEVLARNDGQFAASFPLGSFQGVALDHSVEFDIPVDAPATKTLLIVGNGWIYPTDSSLNVAMAQGEFTPPFGLQLEQQRADGRWQLVRENLGFPAGKNKDVVISAPGDVLSTSRHFRLRTNMEVYWDTLGWTHEVTQTQPTITPLAALRADLRYRGFSELLPVDRRRPDTPIYKVHGMQSRWLDLEGFYTRYGDVQELLAETDDRYVIMNAGDELVFEFSALNSVPEDWKSDFILIGDGWVKDGDFNTTFSQTVHPLPSHTRTDYDGPLIPLEQDPVFREHREDWQRYHTRYISPRQFQRGLMSRGNSISEDRTP
ncbi:MAG: VCBS repeat-containing protein [Planctomycetales bacterium]|nr:VCBS repeat-containing protein [Planctomycetales bacterium]